MRVHLNGRLVRESEGVVPVCDRGLLFGDGIFESMRAVRGRVFRLDRHLARLRRSAAAIGLALPDRLADLGRDVAELLRANGLSDARVRLTVTRGPGRPGDYLFAPGPPTVPMIAAPFRGLDPALHERGVALVVSRRRQVPPESIDPSIKSISRLGSVLARREADDGGAFEAVLLDLHGHLTEGTASNLFLVEGGRLRTPPVPEGGLPGVTREAVLELARLEGIDAAEERLPAARLHAAHEVLLTNASWEVLPAVSVDGKPVGGGKPGPVARTLLARYRDLLRRECGGD